MVCLEQSRVAYLNNLNLQVCGVETNSIDYLIVCLLLNNLNFHSWIFHLTGGCPVLFQHILLHQCINVQFADGAGC